MATDTPESGTAGTGAWRARNRRARAGPGRAEFAAAGGAPADASSGSRQLRLEPNQPGLDAIGGVAQRIDALQELVELRAVGEVAAFFLKVLGEVLAGGAAGPARKFERAPREFGQAARGKITYPARQLLLGIGARQHE